MRPTILSTLKRILSITMQRYCELHETDQKFVRRAGIAMLVIFAATVCLTPVVSAIILLVLGALVCFYYLFLVDRYNFWQAAALGTAKMICSMSSRVCEMLGVFEPEDEGEFMRKEDIITQHKEMTLIRIRLDKTPIFLCSEKDFYKQIMQALTRHIDKGNLTGFPRTHVGGKTALCIWRIQIDKKDQVIIDFANRCDPDTQRLLKKYPPMNFSSRTSVTIPSADELDC